MRARGATVGLWVVLLAGAAAACSTASVLTGRASGVQDLADRAEARGAYRCAPQELALARAHLEFARTELSQGNTDRAAAHLRFAEPNAKAAFELSPPSRCTDSGKSDRDLDGILDPADQCPDVPEDLDGDRDTDGCPDDSDTDGDTVVDSRDLCLLDPEDLDSYLDSDGCPEADNDLDTVLDTVDKCPNDPEDRDGFTDDDGCADPDNDTDGLTDVDDKCPNEAGPLDADGCPRVYKDVQVTDSAIKISQKVFFDFNKATIQDRSYDLLNTVAQVLHDFPNIVVEVQGHTDDKGNDKYNRDLSQKRAEAVRAYLVAKGMDPSRMTARGYGEERPLESNKTVAGREANRRVEFVRTDVGSTP